MAIVSNVSTAHLWTWPYLPLSMYERTKQYVSPFTVPLGQWNAMHRESRCCSIWSEGSLWRRVRTGASLATLLVAIASPLLAQTCDSGSDQVGVSLEGAIALARRQASSVAAARARLALRQADVRATTAELFPRVDGTFAFVERSYNRQQQGLGPLVIGPFGNTDARLGARMAVAPFVTWPRAEAAKADVEGEQSALVASRGEAAFAAAHAYLQLARTAAECSTRLADLALARRLLDIARARVRVGAAARTDSLRAGIEVALAEVALVRSTAAVDTARTALSIATGGTIGESILPLDSLTTLARLPIDTTIELNAAQGARAELTAYAGQERAARLRVRAARAEALPVVIASGDVGVNGAGLFNADYTGSFAVGLSVPLFTGGLTGAHVEARQAEVAEVATRARQTSDLVASEWANARVRVRTSAALVVSAQAAGNLADAELQDTEARYRVGEVGSLDLVAALQAVLRAREVHLQADYDAAAARLQWLHATGVLDDTRADIHTGVGGKPPRR